MNLKYILEVAIIAPVVEIIFNVHTFTTPIAIILSCFSAIMSVIYLYFYKTTIQIDEDHSSVIEGRWPTSVTFKSIRIINNIMRKLIIAMGCIAFSLLTSCATTPSNQLLKFQNTLNELIIRNNTHSSIYNVTLKNTKTGSTVSCNTILAKRDCSLGFQAIKLTNNPAVVLWSQHGNQYTQSLPRNRNSVKNTAKTFKAIVTILNNGKLKLNLE